MRKLILVLLIFFCAFTVEAADLILNAAPTSVCFSPDGGCTEVVVRAIGSAQGEVLVQAYGFTSKDIATALIGAKKRGVSVEVILDKSNASQKYTAATFLRNMGISTYIDYRHAIAHNKIIIIDRATVITGSFNFTAAAENRNAENLVVIASREIAAIYRDNWLLHKAHSEAY
ncbi:MAG: phospholipase D family protein [Nitrospirota bacterium]